ncbi:hypothetical protein BDV97DRAFT_363024 [Delphinella strobiligena]|nr:hypothetical protein BDV97DRAFT_363024 [Delphinella strobiligena]
MLSSTLPIFILGAGLCHAAALGSRGDTPRIVAPHEAILYGSDGRMEIWNRTDILSLSPSFFSSSQSSDELQKRSDIGTASSGQGSRLEKRGNVDIVIEAADSSFLGNDIAMSPVNQAPKTSKGSIAVTSGYNIANSITVGESTKLTIVEDVLDVTTSIDYSQSWTSTQSTTNTFQIDEGKYGIVVSNPKTLRKTGTVWTGRIGSEGTSTTYQADSYTSEAYNNLQWVQGVISLCQSDTYPIPMCRGDGTLS